MLFYKNREIKEERKMKDRKISIQYVYANINNFTEKERVDFLPNLLKMFSPVSKKTIEKFQDEWDWNAGKPFEDFLKEQNKVIKQCIELETSTFVGDVVRKQFNLEPLRIEDEIKG